MIRIQYEDEENHVYMSIVEEKKKNEN